MSGEEIVKKLIFLEKDTIKALSIQAITKDYRSVKAYMEAILKEVAKNQITTNDDD